MMTLKYCPRCRADVEDAGGFCLLGHRFPEKNEDPIADLRAEVDRAFKKVQLDISHVFEDKLEELIPEPTGSIYEQLKADEPVAASGRPLTDQEAAEDIVASRRDLWRALSDDAPVERDDPILSFSPSPRMEWGPGKSRLRRQKGE